MKTKLKLKKSAMIGTALWTVLFVNVPAARAQVTIGANLDPNPGSLLDLKESNESVNSTKGLGMPRVNLSDWNELAPILSNPTAKDKLDHIGLVVYNMPGKSWMLPGLYVWDGAKWAGIGVENTVKPPYYTCEPAYYGTDATKYVDMPISRTYNGKNTLRFLTYNLGANPNMTVKEQMEYTSGGADDITVFGGLYQWGRKDAEHSLRCSKNDVPGSFTTDRYNTVAEAVADGKFVITEKINWLYSVIDDLWGNGLAIDDTPGGNDNPVKNTANDPCPVGYRVPTQYEWALLGHENGDIGDSSNDYFYTDDADNSTIAGHAATPTGNPGITWVRVSDGKAAASDTWTDDGKTRGYALYDSTVWTAAEEKYKNGTELLSDPAAPEPLLFLPAAGYRAFDYGYVYSTGSSGDYWSSVAGGGYSYEMLFTDDSVTVRDITAHAMGMSVRCIAE